jgi:hypothetical protein
MKLGTKKLTLVAILLAAGAIFAIVPLPIEGNG